MTEPTTSNEYGTFRPADQIYVGNGLSNQDGGPESGNDETILMDRAIDSDSSMERGSDETAVIPRQRDTHHTASATRPAEGWDRDVSRGTASVEPAPHGRARALGALAWIMPTIIVGIVATIRLNWAGLDTDELDVWGFAGTSWHNASALLRAIPPGDVPYYLFIHAWASLFGRSDYALRMPSVLAITGATALVSVITTRLVSPRAGALAALLFVALPATSRIGQNIGPEALTVLAGAVATLAFVWLLDRPRSSRYVVYGLAVVLVGLCQVGGLAIILAHGLVVALLRRKSIFGWLTAAVVGSLPGLALALYSTVEPKRLSISTTSHLGHLTGLLTTTFGSVAAGAVIIGLSLISVSLRRPGGLFAMWGLVPLVVALAVSNYVGLDPVLVSIVAVPAWACLGAIALARTPTVRGLTAVAVVVLLGVSTQLAIRRVDGHLQATRSLAAVLTQQEQDGDAIVYGPVAGDAQSARDIVARYVPAPSQPADILLTTPARTHGRAIAEECADADKCLGKTQRVWVIRVNSTGDPLDGMEATKDGALRVRYAASQTWRFTGLTLTLFTLRPVSGK